MINIIVTKTNIYDVIIKNNWLLKANANINYISVKYKLMPFEKCK